MTARDQGASLALMDLDTDHQLLHTLASGDLGFEQDITTVLSEVLDLLRRRWNIPT